MNKVGFLDGNSCHQLPKFNYYQLSKTYGFFKGIKYIIKKAILGQQTLELHFSNGRLNDAF